MGGGMDFSNCLERDTTRKILTGLDDPSDVVRVGSVSRNWHHIVVENGVSKELCMKMFPELSMFSRVIELNNPDPKESMEVGSSNSNEWDILEIEHRAYALLAHACGSLPVRDFDLKAISASSTDNYPEESVHNTLARRAKIAGRGPYWSSKGHKNPEVPEMLTYKLVSDFAVITEISVHPFQAYFQHGLPIYSSSGVRFRMGYAKFPIPVDPMEDPMEESCHDDKFVWIYTSDVFPMAQENRMQTFMLPEPVLCVGGILQIELVGRVQRQEMDDLFYICVSRVQVKGQSLSPLFGVETHEPSGELILTYNRQAKFNNQPSSPRNESDAISTDELERQVMLPIVNMLHANVVDFEEYYESDENEWNDADEEADEEFVL